MFLQLLITLDSKDKLYFLLFILLGVDMMPSTLQMEFIRLAAHVADMKQAHYDELLTLTSLVSVLIDKGIISQEEIALKKQLLDHSFESIIPHALHPME